MMVRAPSAGSRYFEVKKLVEGASLHTICEEARCPNISECWGRGTATFQILGDTCTRACRYCYVHSGRPEHPPDPLEPLRLAPGAGEENPKHAGDPDPYKSDVPADVEIDEDDFDEEDIDLTGDDDLNEDANK